MLGAMYARALSATGLTYAVVHHLGLLPNGIAAGPDGTRWADWLDLAVPWLVLAPAAMTLWAANAGRRAWLLFGAGAVAYASGHGIHLAANSVGNAEPSATAHLWDEVVGHYLWFAGVALVLAAVAATMEGRPRPKPVGYGVAVAVGATWTTNAIGGGTVVFSLAVAVAAAGYGWAHRRELGSSLLVGFAPAVPALCIAIALGHL